MMEKRYYRKHLIDRFAWSSPDAMRATGAIPWMRQRYACNFYLGLAKRYWRIREFSVGIYKLKIKRRLPPEFGYADGVIALLFINNDRERGWQVHWASENACTRAGYDDCRAFHFDGTLFVFDQNVRLIAQLCHQIESLERLMRTEVE